ncbi:MAG: hypothetical protein ABIJ26_02345, partial [Candidatus Margulisiibacteriota bacterium]
AFSILCQIEPSEFTMLCETTGIDCDLLIETIDGKQEPIFINPPEEKCPPGILSDVMKHHFGVDIAKAETSNILSCFKKGSPEQIIASWKELFLHPDVPYWDKVSIIIARGKIGLYSDKEEQFIKRQLILLGDKYKLAIQKMDEEGVEI